MASIQEYPRRSASSFPIQRAKKPYQRLNRCLNVAIVLMLLAIVAILPGACKEQRHYDAANAKGWCARGHILECESTEFSHAA